MAISVRKVLAALKRYLPLLQVALVVLAVWTLHRELKQTSLADLRVTMRNIPPASLLLSLLVVSADYLLLTLGDWFAVRESGGNLPYAKVAFVSFVSNAIGFNVGASALSGGSLRYRLYSSLGMTPSQIASVILICQVVFLFGIPGVSGVALLFAPGEALAYLHWSPVARYGLGALCLGVPLALLALRASSGNVGAPVVAGHMVPLPRAAVMAKQFGIGFLDPVVASLVLYFLLPGGEVSIGSFCAAFVVAALAGAVSQVPGGLGVFDASLIAILSPHYPRAALVGGLLVYRFFYYVVPLVAAVLLLALAELRGRIAGTMSRVAALLPYGLALLTFLAGTGMLMTTALPLADTRLAVLRGLVSLPLLEASHFLKSVLGTGLLFLSWGLAKRMRSAWVMSATALALAVPSVFASGLNVHLALFLLLALLMLLVGRRRFYRRSYFSTPPAGWLAVAIAVISAVVWLGFFSFRHVEYSGELWWQFAFSRSAPRFLRAMVGMGVSVLAAFFLLWLRPARPVDVPPNMEALRRLVAASDDCDVALALLGDKRFVLTDDGGAAVMYATSGEFWVAMGNPIGSPERARDAIWRFCEEADGAGAKPVFYEADDRWRLVFLDAGLHLQPIGEEGAVDVSDMTENLDGGKWKHVRGVRRRLLEAGCNFRIMEEAERADLMPALRTISDKWLAHMHGAEKGFSLGFFDEAYLSHFPIALVEISGQPVAFCNLWLSGTGGTFSVDLMRYSDEAPPDVMTFLFLETMLWGKTQGFRYFKLGMTPFSSMDPNNSLWERGAEFIYRHGERFYNFQGLRMYKEKFHPQWRKKYLVYPGAVSLPSLLPDLMLLISGRRERSHQ